MIRIPLYADPTDSRGYNQLGNEFSKIQSNDRYRGLMESEILNPISLQNNVVDNLYFEGFSNQMKIFENNSDVSDNILYSDAQQMERLRQIGSLNRPLTAEERAIGEAVGFDLDPTIRNVLVNESTNAGNNIYAQESQDFVKQIQKDVEEYSNEVNLYYKGVPQDQRLSALLRGDERALDDLVPTRSEDGVVDSVIKLLDDMDKQEKEDIRTTIEMRKRILKARRGGKTPPKRTEEKIIKEEDIRKNIKKENVKSSKPKAKGRRPKDEL
jgi:hypothetical protein